MNNAMHDTQKPSKWKTVLLKSMGVGLGIGVGICLIVTFAYYVMSRPKGWDKDAIKCSTQAVYLVLPINPNSNQTVPHRASLFMNLVMTNRTSSDYELGDGLEIMQVSKDTEAITESNGKTKKAYIPAHHSAVVHWSIDDMYCDLVDKNEKYIPGSDEACYKKWTDVYKGLVVFDQGTKYEIRVDLPNTLSEFVPQS